jgi:hypothetical protein
MIATLFQFRLYFKFLFAVMQSNDLGLNPSILLVLVLVLVLNVNVDSEAKRIAVS